jgi:murein L,D-transpeptidase YafK
MRILRLSAALLIAASASPYALAAPASECLASVEALAGSPYVQATDPRLRAGALIVVQKDARRVQLFSGGQAVPGTCTTVALAAGYVSGHKQRQGDLRTPEGWYRTSDRPWSQFHGAITVHYPRAEDAARGLRAGLITQAQHDAIVAAERAGHAPPMNTALGGQIVVHGGGASADWTLGCPALDDPDIDRLRALLPPGMATDLLILP